ncbi:MAG: hypothetical protein AAB385_07415 [Planctomycetota bacterium]
MGRLTDDMTRLVGEIHAARDERGRATAEMKRSVARLRSTFAADLVGTRAAWLGTRAFVSPRAVVPESVAPKGREAKGEREEVLGEAAEERRRLEAERRARAEAEPGRKARGRPRPR